jgi:hypothetical protein
MPTRLSCRLGWHRWQPLKAAGEGGWYKKCRACGKLDDGETLPVLPFVLSGSVFVAGVVVALTLQSLLGPLLIIGGVWGLGLTMLPTTFERIGVWLSTGSVRRKPKS